MTKPYCWICQSPGTVHITGPSWVCDNHWDGTGGNYMEGHTDD